MRTRTKICGITRWEDALAAIELGADALGFVFVPSSPRYISAEKAAAMASRLPAFVSAVGLFMDQSPAEVREVVERVPLDLLQFHGNEQAQDCTQHGCAYIKAIPMGDEVDVGSYIAAHPMAKGFLLDSHSTGGSGGSGHAFDWGRIPRGLDIPMILAGGLKPGNVAQAIAEARPYAVDISSGVEAEKGIKDKGLMKAFMQAVREGDRIYEID